jgi:hypothetical protein
MLLKPPASCTLLLSCPCFSTFMFLEFTRNTFHFGAMHLEYHPFFCLQDLLALFLHIFTQLSYSHVPIQVILLTIAASPTAIATSLILCHFSSVFITSYFVV